MGGMHVLQTALVKMKMHVILNNKRIYCTCYLKIFHRDKYPSTFKSVLSCQIWTLSFSNPRWGPGLDKKFEKAINST